MTNGDGELFSCGFFGGLAVALFFSDLNGCPVASGLALSEGTGGRELWLRLCDVSVYSFFFLRRRGVVVTVFHLVRCAFFFPLGSHRRLLFFRGVSLFFLCVCGYVNFYVSSGFRVCAVLPLALASAPGPCYAPSVAVAAPALQEVARHGAELKGLCH
jgi:hypothetical protein